ncbi:dynein regulatory complex subunit 7 [Cylas formicarius]|uniref:dynein regulatory complex subunit 7 n=1 Tax=Cylas formicarius TaxID=197179 RepID=UPI002958907A|nr:dynein regulatory complex subunit 7 [Cylas formicarius]
MSNEEPDVFESDVVGQDSDGTESEVKTEDGETRPVSFLEKLDLPRSLRDPIAITTDYLKQITRELGRIELCWPEIPQPPHDFPSSYRSNSAKEKLLLLYAENFRRQFGEKFPRRKLLLACENECGLPKMVSTAIRPMTLRHAEIDAWRECAKFVADYLQYEPLEDPVALPARLRSPHTTFAKQGGHCFEIATVLCSLLVGMGYDAFVVSGYAVEDVTMRIMTRVDSPYPPFEEDDAVKVEEAAVGKYRVAQPRKLESKFLAMMKQKESLRLQEERRRVEEEEKRRVLEEEKRPHDELEGRRVHGWVLLLAGQPDVPESVFVEPSTGRSHHLDSDLYGVVEGVWNHENYWANVQDGGERASFDLNDVDKWEHLLVGEPLKWRRRKPTEMGDEEADDVYDEKHLDMPPSWSSKIDVPHEALAKRYPDGCRTTHYKKALVEEYAPYVLEDGLTARITRDTLDEEIYVNRRDKLKRRMVDARTGRNVEYFDYGREDGVVKHVYYNDRDDRITHTVQSFVRDGNEKDAVANDALTGQNVGNLDYGEDDVAKRDKRTIFFNHRARFDGLSRVERSKHSLTEHYRGRDDKMAYRRTDYAKGTDGKILNIVQRFERDESIASACDDVRIREFDLENGEIRIKYHYGPENVTASTRTFVKPPVSDGEGITFKAELTSGYQARIGAKPPGQLRLFLELERQLRDEKAVIESVREFEKQIESFLLLRAHEMAFPKLDVSIYDRERNREHKLGMLERDEMLRTRREREVEEEIEYLAPYLARLGNPASLTCEEAADVKYGCLDDFKRSLLSRANAIQTAFERVSETVQEKQMWYTHHHDSLTVDEEREYFRDINDTLFRLRTLEMRLTRHKELSSVRYDAMLAYLNNHPALGVLQ